MTPQYIMKKSLCREPFCVHGQHSAQMHIDNLQYAASYAEPGYDDPAKGILFSDWNYFPRDLTDILETYGYAIEWEDEWSTCYECGKAVRTSPNCHNWTPSYVIEDEIICKDCSERS